MKVWRLEGVAYSSAQIADAVEAGLAGEAKRLDEEQSVYGLDALDELKIHPVLGRALAAAGYGVFCEERYPSGRQRVKASEGDRCDLVLTPGGQPLAAPDREPTLFDPPHPVALEDAFWLEVKVVCQFTAEGPNRNYASLLLSGVHEDVAKLSRDRRIGHAGLLIILFARDEVVVEHDLGAWLKRGLERELPLGSPAVRTFAITDRLGNRLCATSVYPVGRLPAEAIPSSRHPPR